MIVRSAALQLDPKKNKFNMPPLAVESVHPESGKANRIEIEVSEPQIAVGKPK